MLAIKAPNEKTVNLVLAVFISLIFGVTIIQYDIKAVAFLAVGFFAIIFFTRIQYAFYFILASRGIVDIFYSVETTGSFKVTQYLAVVVTLFFLWYIVFSDLSIIRLGINKIYGTFIALCILPVFFSQNLMEGFASWLKLLQPILIINVTVLIVLAMGNKLFKKTADAVCWCTIAAFLVPFVLFIKNYLQGTHTVMSGYERYSTVGAYTNLFSYYLFTVFPVCLFFYSTSAQRSRKLFWLIFMAILLFCIYKTYTRNVWIGIAVLLFAWNLLRKNFKIILPLMCMFGLIVILSSDVRDRFGDLSVILESLNSRGFFGIDPQLLSGRIGIWQGNLHYFLYKSTFIEKLLGNGFDVKVAVSSLNYTQEVIEEHNNYMTLLMNTGICGLFVYCLFIGKLFQESFKLLRKANDLYAKNLAQVFISILFAYVIICFFTHMVWKINYQYYFSTFAGLIIAANMREEEKRNLSDAG
ncbi:MAG: hypothetical protein HRF42_01205 [Candidatus Brocadia sp.]|jgi:hypothetical protein